MAKTTLCERQTVNVP